MGGMGGYGMGGMGGMGGYGMGGMGGYGMGGYGMGGGGIDYAREYRGENLMTLIEDTIEPDSWWDAGGEGTITVYEGKKLIVLQSRDIHTEIETLLNEMRKSLGHQVAIETRFLVVTENFLVDIGLDVDFTWDPGGKWSPFQFRQGSLGAVVPEITKVPGSLAGISTALEVGGGGISGAASYGNILDDLQVSFLIKATEAHTDAATLTAPKVTVLSGETATFEIQRDISYALPPTVLGSGGSTGITPYGTTGANYGSSSVLQNVQRIPAGTTLTITPTIDPDKKYVLLNIITFLQDLIRLKAHEVEAVIPGQAGSPTTRVPYRIEVPETERSSVQTRVSVPDGGTLLLGGQRITAEVQKEAGVPVLSKIPLLGRLFSNRTMVKDHKILLILVKPTIILQEEREQEAIAAMEDKI
jgi:type II secretory pathway component GspD/PulD (secretin)